MLILSQWEAALITGLNYWKSEGSSEAPKSRRKDEESRPDLPLALGRRYVTIGSKENSRGPGPFRSGTLTADQLGELLAIAGFIIFLVNSMGRSRQRKTGQPAAGAWGQWLRWGDFAAFGLILAGLALMWSQNP
jgi:hypothetical protein